MNKWLWGAILLSLVLQVAVIYVPLLQQAFSTVSLRVGDWLCCTAVASSVLWLPELAQRARREPDLHTDRHAVRINKISRYLHSTRKLLHWASAFEGSR